MSSCVADLLSVKWKFVDSNSLNPMGYFTSFSGWVIRVINWNCCLLAYQYFVVNFLSFFPKQFFGSSRDSDWW